MSAVNHFEKLFRQDASNWAGGSLNDSRIDSVGRAVGLRYNNFVDVAALYCQGTSDFNASAIQKALDVIKATNCVIELAPGNWTINSNITFPANVVLRMPFGAKLVVSTGKALTLNCEIDAGLYQIISNSGTLSGSIINPRILPEWFGAVRDGATNDATAIQAALDLANNNGRCVFLSAGTYIISTGLTVNASSAIRGEGRYLSVIKYSGGSSLDLITLIAGASKISLSSFSLDINSAVGNSTGRGIYLTTFDKVDIIDMEILDATVGGIYASGTSGSSTRLLIKNCRFTGNNNSAVLALQHCHYVSVENNHIDNSEGFFLFAVKFANYAGNRIYSSSSAIRVVDIRESCQNVNLVQNTIETNASIVIYFVGNNSVDFIVAQNNIYNSKSSGGCIYVGPTGGSGTGISRIEISQNILKGNTSTDAGIRLYAGVTNVKISGNIISGYSGAGGDAIELASSATVQYIQIFNNNLRGNTNFVTIGASVSRNEVSTHGNLCDDTIVF
jgi:hypothetical protein